MNRLFIRVLTLTNLSTTINIPFCKEINECNADKQEDNELYIFAVLQNLILKLLLWNKRMQIPAKCGKNTIPHSGAKSSIKDKLPVLHLCQSGWNRNKMTNTRNQSSGYCCHHTMVIEILLATLDFLLIQQAEVTDTAIGELINYRTTEVITGNIVDRGSNVSTERLSPARTVPE